MLRNKNVGQWLHQIWYYPKFYNKLYIGLACLLDPECGGWRQ
jgi:hypothetical protein